MFVLGQISMRGNCSLSLLKHKGVDSDYIGKYKDQKAFSFYESGFVGTLYTYTVPAKKMLFVKGDVTPSTKVQDDPHKA